MTQVLKQSPTRFGKYFLVIFGAILIAGVGFYLWQTYSWRIGIDTSCVKSGEHNIVGSSMEPLLMEGKKVKGLIGYYDCNEIKKEEIAILEFKTREETFVKKIIGVPGDRLEFTEDNQAKLNGEILKNSIGEIYLFSVQAQRIINIPLKDGKIPEARYFVLSEEKGPTAFDSRQYSFIQKDHLKGRVIK